MDSWVEEAETYVAQDAVAVGCSAAQLDVTSGRTQSTYDRPSSLPHILCWDWTARPCGVTDPTCLLDFFQTWSSCLFQDQTTFPSHKVRRRPPRSPSPPRSPWRDTSLTTRKTRLSHTGGGFVPARKKQQP